MVGSCPMSQLTGHHDGILRNSPQSKAVYLVLGLLKLRVLRFRSDENGDVRVGVFPEREEILIGRLGFGVGRIEVTEPARCEQMPELELTVASWLLP